MSNKYKFDLSKGSYAPLVNKTVFQSGAQISTDAVSAVIALPFPFTMYGTTETNISIVNNGYVLFGSDIFNAVATYSPISSTVGNIGKFNSLISAFGNQLIPATVGSPEISYGTNDNGDFAIQFQDVAIISAPLSRFTFQIVLKADGKTVQIVWGDNCTGQAVNSRASQIGIRGTQTPRLDANGVVYATPFTEVYDNLMMTNGDYNKFEPNPNLSGGITIGQTPPSAVVTRMITGLTITMPKAGLTYQWSPN